MTPKALGGAACGASITASMAPAGPARVARRADAGGLFDSKELDVEQQRGARRHHSARAALSVAQSGRDHEPPLSADRHAGHALIPAFDHRAVADAGATRRAG